MSLRRESNRAKRIKHTNVGDGKTHEIDKRIRAREEASNTAGDAKGPEVRGD